MTIPRHPDGNTHTQTERDRQTDRQTETKTEDSCHLALSNFSTSPQPCSNRSATRLASCSYQAPQHDLLLEMPAPMGGSNSEKAAQSLGCIGGDHGKYVRRAHLYYRLRLANTLQIIPKISLARNMIHHSSCACGPELPIPSSCSRRANASASEQARRAGSLEDGGGCQLGRKPSHELGCSIGMVSVTM